MLLPYLGDIRVLLGVVWNWINITVIFQKLEEKKKNWKKRKNRKRKEKKEDNSYTFWKKSEKKREYKMAKKLLEIKWNTN